MKKYAIIGIIVGLIPTYVFGASARYNQLIEEKQRKMQELEKCTGNVNAWKIAGISTTGLTAVGVAGNVVLAKQRGDLDKSIQNTTNQISTTKDKIAELKAKEQKSGYSETEQTPAQTENDESTEQQVPANGTDCQDTAKNTDGNVTAASYQDGKCEVTSCADGYDINEDKNGCVEIEKPKPAENKIAKTTTKPQPKATPKCDFSKFWTNKTGSIDVGKKQSINCTEAKRILGDAINIDNAASCSVKCVAEDELNFKVDSCNNGYGLEKGMCVSTAPKPQPKATPKCDFSKFWTNKTGSIDVGKKQSIDCTEAKRILGDAINIDNAASCSVNCVAEDELNFKVDSCRYGSLVGNKCILPVSNSKQTSFSLGKKVGPVTSSAQQNGVASWYGGAQ